jgi:hypothetical protein
MDRMVSSGILSSETEFKLEELLPDRLVALISGSPSEALQLIYNYRLGLRNSELTVEELPDELLRIMTMKKDKMIDAIARLRLGISYREFLDYPEKIDSEIRIRLLREIYNAEIDVELIVAGFLPDAVRGIIRPVLSSVSEASIGANNNFICIGTGAAAAEQVLHRREQQSFYDLNLTLYNVFEAKKLAELARDVGFETIMIVMEPSINAGTYRLRSLSDQMLTFLLERYLEYGPKRMFSLRLPEGISIFRS